MPNDSEAPLPVLVGTKKQGAPRTYKTPFWRPLVESALLIGFQIGGIRGGYFLYRTYLFAVPAKNIPGIALSASFALVTLAYTVAAVWGRQPRAMRKSRLSSDWWLIMLVAVLVLWKKGFMSLWLLGMVQGVGSAAGLQLSLWIAPPDPEETTEDTHDGP